MKTDWPTKERDIAAAEAIISAFSDERQLLGIFELRHNQQSVQIQLADWLLALITHFREIYGHKKGDLVIKKLVTEFLVAGNTRH